MKEESLLKECVNLLNDTSRPSSHLFHFFNTMPKLSPQAQAVLDAYRSSHLSIDNLAAALRAAALYCKQDRIRLLVIADELENLGHL
jgi:hypothetical protein